MYKPSVIRILAIAASFLTAACATLDEAPFEEKDLRLPMTFTASFREEPGTRTALTDGRQVRWSELDSIQVFSGGTSSFFRIKRLSEDGMSASFTGYAVPDTVYYALYPCDPAAELGPDGTLTTSLRTRQEAKDSSFAESTNLSVARTTGNDLHFRNVGALLSLRILNDGIASVTLTSGTPLSGGKAAIRFQEGVRPSLELTDAAGEVTLAGRFQGGGRYYFVVYPGSHGEGFGLCFRDSTGRRALYSNTTACEIVANANIRLGDIRISDDKWIGPEADFDHTTCCGAYHIEDDYALYASDPYRDQWVLVAGPVRSFRIQNPQAGLYLDIGLPASLTAGTTFRARLVQNYVSSISHNAVHSFTVLRTDEDGFAWLRDEDGVGYVVKTNGL
jgi:hypothetical protein